MLLARKAAGAAAASSRSGLRSPALPARQQRQSRRRSTVVRADGNFIVDVLASSVAGAAATAVTLITAEDTDKEIERIQTVEGAAPVGAAILADAVAHSLPGLNILLALASEPLGAAAGVAYMFTIVLSAPAVDPSNMAPKGTVINAEKATDSRGNIRVPFTQIIQTALQVVDTSNDGSSGAGWTIGENGMPKLPVTSVAAVVGIGTLILEAAAHAPVLSLFFPRVLQVAGWLAVAGYLLDKRTISSVSESVKASSD